MVTANLATLVGFSLVAAAVLAVFFSPYRRWLSFMAAGMLAWGLIEVIRVGTQALFELPMTYSYLTALTAVKIDVQSVLWLNAVISNIHQCMKMTSSSYLAVKFSNISEIMHLRVHFSFRNMIQSPASAWL